MCVTILHATRLKNKQTMQKNTKQQLSTSNRTNQYTTILA